MYKELQAYFYFTKSERNGIKLLLSLLVLLLLFLIFSPRIFEKKNKVDFSKFKMALEKLEANSIEKSSLASIKSTKEKPSNTIDAELFTFNPNLATKEELQSLGLSPKQVNTIVNYRNKGGKFYKKEDLQKIYSINKTDYLRLENYISIPKTNYKPKKEEIQSITTTENQIELFKFDPNTISKDDLQRLGLREKTINILLNYRAKGAKFRKKEDLSKIYGLSKETYQRLENYIQLPQAIQAKSTPSTKPAKEHFHKTNPPKEINPIDVNKASIADWESLRGIGPTYANRIVKFRNKLGGFYKLSQIKDTYGLPDSTFLAIKPYLVLSPISAKINLNTVNLEELKAHPYIKWKQATTIIRYRENHGNFSKIEDILKIGSIDQEFFNKIKAYLTIE